MQQIKICKQCKKEFYKSPSVSQKKWNYNVKFCSHKCYNSYRIEHIEEYPSGMIGNTFNLGKKYSKERVQKMAEGNHRTRTPEYYKNHPELIEYASKLGKSNKGKKYKQRKISQLYRDIHRELRLKQIFPQKDSSIELKTQKQLDSKKIKYVKHYPILGQPDIFIPTSNTFGIAIFIDGCYWHNCHECKRVHQNSSKKLDAEARKQWYDDFRIKHQLELEGYKVIRIWEHDIIKKDFDIMKFLEGVELNAISK